MVLLHCHHLELLSHFLRQAEGFHLLGNCQLRDTVTIQSLSLRLLEQTIGEQELPLGNQAREFKTSIFGGIGAGVKIYKRGDVL